MPGHSRPTPPRSSGSAQMRGGASPLRRLGRRRFRPVVAPAGQGVFGYPSRPMSAPDVTITLPDGASKTVPAGTTIADFVRTQIGPGLAKAALFAKLDDEPVDLSRTLDQPARLAI